MDIDERYKKGKIYKLICTETLDLYIGSTIMSLYDRLRCHRKSSNNCESKYFVNPVIELIENYPCNNKLELRKREQYYIDSFECINIYKSYQTKEDRKEYMKKFGKKYREDNKEKRKEYNKKWREDNKEKQDKIQKKWVENNKEKLNAYARKRYQIKKQNKYLDNI